MKKTCPVTPLRFSMLLGLASPLPSCLAVSYKERLGGGGEGVGRIMRCCRVLQGILEVLRHGHALFTASFNPTKVLLTYTVQALYYWREGRGLLEYKVMPSFRDVAHDGVLCTFRNTDQHQTGTSGVVRQGRRHGQSITYKITPCWLTLLQPNRRKAVLGQPSRLRTHWFVQYSEGTKRHNQGYLRSPPILHHDCKGTVSWPCFQASNTVCHFPGN
jgi:hypothetical protein